MTSDSWYKHLKTSSWCLKTFWCTGIAVGSNSAWALGSLDCLGKEFRLEWSVCMYDGIVSACMPSFSLVTLIMCLAFVFSSHHGFDWNVIDINNLCVCVCIYILAVSIYGIWFYDKEDCQRIAELMKKWVFPSIFNSHNFLCSHLGYFWFWLQFHLMIPVP